ncbi:peptidoglycan-binding domain-containing protein [Devosia sp. 63-57]|uniref:peptidoglycan-binding domain-containing protein n=1 Tax=Devosia sp. 63-57 TaxID=1895751 RepID=UPI00086980DB|nr:peptidoglycan-binding domain-containing protein [Devosia sp. 63-57]ODT47412.1 MAG: hypothetical protein ABS74_14125 [Pelagibacterium sp. SCN 63-126]ODU87088.1 MAG: hypothetical protein ABT14_06540 [Pelagibacterium sp. SCN 63-17]OJX42880.1 MAG: hypothetical protein BGO80_15745 [Devosia sp. 63-57]
MTASTLSQLPLMAGGALLGTLKTGGQWAFSQYMRAPLASTGLLALVTMTALAGSNALYFQRGMHPSPFFGVARDVPVAPMPLPVEERPESAAVLSLPAASQPQTTGSVQPAPQVVPDAPVGNTEVFAVQKKLSELKLFDGKVDGYYGPMTARAIRAFEERNGMKPMGAMEPSVIRAILSSDAGGMVSAPVQQQAQPQPQPVAVVAPQPVAVAPTPAPAPIVVQPVVQQADQVVGRLPALSPAEQTFDRVAESAASSIDNIIAAVDNSRTPPAQMANPPIPTAPVAQAATTQPMPAPVVQQPVQQVQEPAVMVASISEVPQSGPPATNVQLVTQIQRGLASLGFFRAPIDGKPGPETARAIREFENFHSYKMTGQVQPDLVELLVKAGASI